jgi:hypothetical protein
MTAQARLMRKVNQLLKMPLRSLKRSSDGGATAFGVCVEAAAATTGAAEATGTTEVSDDELPHNS